MAQQTLVFKSLASSMNEWRKAQQHGSINDNVFTVFQKAETVGNFEHPAATQDSLRSGIDSSSTTGL